MGYFLNEKYKIVMNKNFNNLDLLKAQYSYAHQRKIAKRIGTKKLQYLLSINNKNSFLKTKLKKKKKIICGTELSGANSFPYVFIQQCRISLFFLFRSISFDDH